MTIFIKRVYAAPALEDGIRILVDRLWPRGLSKEKAALNEWAKDIAPSNELRNWFHHDPDKWEEFQQRYKQELRQNSKEVERIRQLMGHKDVTLLYGAHDEIHNQAVVLQHVLEQGFV